MLDDDKVLDDEDRSGDGKKFSSASKDAKKNHLTVSIYLLLLEVLF